MRARGKRERGGRKRKCGAFLIKAGVNSEPRFFFTLLLRIPPVFSSSPLLPSFDPVSSNSSSSSRCMRLSWRASTSALFRLSSSSSSSKSFHRPFSPATAKLPPPPPTTTHQLHRIRPAPSPRRMASAPSQADKSAVGPSPEDAAKTWDESDPVLFAAHPIPRSTVFASSPLAFAFVNLRPVVPGHVLVSSKRVAPRFGDLTPDEVADLWLLAQRVGRVAERRQEQEQERGRRQREERAPPALTFALQDGASAGQSVPHVHVHVIPRGGPRDRFLGEEKNDELYPELQRSGAALEAELLKRGGLGKEEAAPAAAAAAAPAPAASARAPAPDPFFQRERKDRTLREMEEEAAALRELFSSS